MAERRSGRCCCERSPPSGDAGRLYKRWQHWRGVLISACEQCGRNTLSELAEPLRIEWRR